MSYWLNRMDDGTFEVTDKASPDARTHGHGPYATELAAHRNALIMLTQERQLVTLAIYETRRRIRACLK